MGKLDIGTIVIAYTIFLFSTVLHELSHALVATYWGDSTPREMGRLTLNPLPHIDMFGTVLLPILTLVTSGGIMGWASTPVDRRQMRDPRWGDFWTSFAGPLANLAIVIVSVILLKVVVSSVGNGLGDFQDTLQHVLGIAIQLNLFLMVLNLLPIPPLDGGHMLQNLLPDRFGDLFAQVGQFGIFILIAVAASGLLNKLVDPLINLALSII